MCTENGFVTKIVNCIFARFEAVKEAKNLLRIYDEVASHFHTSCSASFSPSKFNKLIEAKAL